MTFSERSSCTEEVESGCFVCQLLFSVSRSLYQTRGLNHESQTLNLVLKYADFTLNSNLPMTREQQRDPVDREPGVGRPGVSPWLCHWCTGTAGNLPVPQFPHLEGGEWTYPLVFLQPEENLFSHQCPPQPVVSSSANVTCPEATVMGTHKERDG